MSENIKWWWLWKLYLTGTLKSCSLRTRPVVWVSLVLVTTPRPAAWSLAGHTPRYDSHTLTLLGFLLCMAFVMSDWQRLRQWSQTAGYVGLVGPSVNVHMDRELSSIYDEPVTSEACGRLVWKCLKSFFMKCHGLHLESIYSSRTIMPHVIPMFIILGLPVNFH